VKTGQITAILDLEAVLICRAILCYLVVRQESVCHDADALAMRGFDRKPERCCRRLRLVDEAAALFLKRFYDEVNEWLAVGSAYSVCSRLFPQAFALFGFVFRTPLC
jgi:hypothetical protein